jgi:GT2 family glycosyltransferase
MRHWDYDRPGEVEVLSGCFWLARRAAIADVGGLDERFFFYAEDWDWCKRFRDADWKIMFVPQATATHFGGGSSSNAPLRFSIEMLRANLMYWQKHHGWPGRSAYCLLAVIRQCFRLVIHSLWKLAGSTRASEMKRRFEEDWACLRWLLGSKGS